MPVDLESQLAAYFEWIEERAGVALHADAPTSRRPARAEHQSIATVVPLTAVGDDRVRTPRRLWRAVVVVAAVSMAVIGGIVAIRAARSDPPTGSGAGLVFEAQWFVLDPAATRDVERVGVTEGLSGPLACRRLDRVSGSCDELVGSRAVRYRTADGGEILVASEHGPAISNHWQFLRIDAERATIGGHPALVDGDNPPALVAGDDGSQTEPAQVAVGVETAPNTRVIVQGAPGQERADVVALAESLVPEVELEGLPIVFGDTIPTDAEFPLDSVAARYYANYVDLTANTACVGAFGMPFNNTPICEPVGDGITITVASPSPTGTILIAALPPATTKASVTTDDGTTIPLDVVGVDGFRPRLVFADLDAATPTELVTYTTDGTVIGRAAITNSVQGAGGDLGYLPLEPTTTQDVDGEFDLYTHCGINGALIEGRWWQADPPLDDGNGNPPAGWDNPYQHGTLAAVDEKTLLFTADSGLTVTLQRTNDTERPLICR